jgi:hypothetical protein
MKFKPEDIVVINLSGRGDKDLNTYIDYFKCRRAFPLKLGQVYTISFLAKKPQKDTTSI